MSAIVNLLRTEPVLVAGLVTAAVALVVAFGLSLSTGQTGAISGIVAAILALIARTQVTPTVKLTPTIPTLEPPS